MEANSNIHDPSVRHHNNYNNYSNNNYNHNNPRTTDNRANDIGQSNSYSNSRGNGRTNGNSYSNNRGNGHSNGNGNTYGHNQSNTYSNNQNSNSNINTSSVMSIGYFKSKLITDIKLKYHMINMIYTNVNVYNYRYKIIDSEDVLDNIKKNKENFYLVPHFQGYNFYLIFTKFNDLNVCVLIDKKNIKYKKEQINMRDVNMYQLNIKCNPSIFKNTFIEGRIIRKNEDNIFLIQDCYLLENEKLFTERMNTKLESLDKYLIEKVYDNNIKINVIKLYTVDQINEVAEKMKTTEYIINGFIFIPSRSNMSYIYVNNHEVELLKNELPITDKKYDKDTFIVKKTLMREVFDVMDMDSQKRLGICYIPDIAKSHYMRQLFKDKIYIKMKCNFNEKFKKYEPLEVVT
jgi:hypothetical protein